MKNKKLAFSIIEISLVVLIIGVLLAAISGSKSLIQKTRISTARNLTNSSDVNAITGLIGWFESTLPSSLNTPEDEIQNGIAITTWKNISPTMSNKNLTITGTGTLTYDNNAIGSISSLTFNNISAESTELANFLFGEFSIFIVENNPTVTANETIFSIDAGTDFSIRYNATKNIELNGQGVSNLATTIEPSGKSMHYVSFSTIAQKIAPIGYAYYLNKKLNTDGSTLPTATVSSTSATTPLTNPTKVIIGADALSSNYFSGNISEVIIFNKILDSDEFEAVSTYLGKKYKINLNNS